MDTLKQNGKGKLKIVFYVFNIGAIFNVMWLCYSLFTADKYGFLKN
jgi:hypothetical protein